MPLRCAAAPRTCTVPMSPIATSGATGTPVATSSQGGEGAGDAALRALIVVVAGFDY